MIENQNDFVGDGYFQLKITYYQESDVIELFSGWIKSGRCLVVAMMLALCVCGRASSAPDEVGVRKPYTEPVELAITGYNYTNRYIDDFFVNGNGGGNLYISSPTSGGGGSSCCVRYRPGTLANTVTVRWQSSACYYHKKSSTSTQIYDNIHSFFKEVKVTVFDDIPPDAKYMEVHFYPDGTVQAAVTAHASDPRILLSKTREDNSRFPRCPNDKNPE